MNCHKRILFMVAALFLQVGSAYAAGFGNVGTQFMNLPTADPNGGNVVTGCATAADPLCTVDSTFEKGDYTTVQVVNTPLNGMVYATELFSGSGETPSLPSCDENGFGTPPSAVLYTIGAEFPVQQDTTVVQFSLSGGKFDGDPVFGISDANGAFITPIPISGGGNNKSFVVFQIDSAMLSDHNQLMMRYVLKDTTILATAGNEVTMTVEVKGSFPKTLTIARSETAINVEFSGQSIIPLDPSEDCLKFADHPSVINPTTAKLSQLAIINRSGTNEVNNKLIMQCDGQKEFKFTGSTTDNTAISENSQLKIIFGQFGASTTGVNMMYLDIDGSGNFNAGDILATLSGNTATWDFDNNIINALASQESTAIIIEIDGITGFDIQESPPLAALRIDFQQGNDDDIWSVADILREAEVSMIGCSGSLSVCYVLNVPSIAAMDDISIGVINESGMAAQLTMTLYDMNGVELGSGVLDNSLGTGKSMPFIDTADINTMLGISPIWTTKRAMLEIYSTQPNLKTVAFLKAKCPNGDEYLVDISEGASGSSCE